MALKALRLFTPFLIVLTQSPLTHLPSGVSLAPLQVLASYLSEHMLQSAESMQNAGVVLEVAKAMLFPGNMLAAVLDPKGQSVSAADTYDRGIELAAGRAVPYSKVDHHEVFASRAATLLAWTQPSPP